MSSYVKATNFFTKDALLTGNPDKIIKGAEIDAEYNAIATAVNSKADTNSPTLTGIPIAPTALTGNNTTQLATTAFVTNALQIIYPVGSVYTSTASTNPNTLFGFGTWVAFGEGRVLIGAGAGYTAGITGGSADAVVVSHTHTITDPGHLHTYTAHLNTGAAGPISLDDRMPLTTNDTSSATTGITIDTAGVSGTNANLQPYVVVYMWQRTA